MLRRFFQDYKQLEGKSVEVDEFQPAATALPIIEESLQRYSTAPAQGVPLGRCARSSSAARGRSAAGCCGCWRSAGTRRWAPTPPCRSLAWSRSTPRDLDGAAAWLRRQQPDVVFYPAGFTWVDGCERDPARAYAANLEQPLNLARVAADQGARFVYFSTDYVFDGRRRSLRRGRRRRSRSRSTASPSTTRSWRWPRAGRRALTVRTSWVFGPERQGKNFAYQLAKALRPGQAARLPVGPGLEPELRARRRAGGRAWPSGRLGVDPRRRARSDRPGPVRPGHRRGVRARPVADRRQDDRRARPGGALGPERRPAHASARRDPARA